MQIAINTKVKIYEIIACKIQNLNLRVRETYNKSIKNYWLERGIESENQGKWNWDGNRKNNMEIWKKIHNG